MFRITNPFLLALPLALATAPALAIEADVSPFVFGGQIRTHGFSDDLGQFVDTSGNARVFAYDFAEGISAAPMLVLADPGFNTELFEAEFGVTTGFAPGSHVGIAVQSSLKYWDASGAPAFAEVTSGESILLDSFGVSRRVGTAAQTETTPLLIFEVEGGSEEGALHGHISSILEDESLALVGIYLIEAIVINGELTNAATGEGTLDPAIAPSQSIFFLYNNGLAEDDYEEAVAVFARSLDGTATPAVPEPAALWMVGAAALALARRRRVKA